MREDRDAVKYRQLFRREDAGDGAADVIRRSSCQTERADVPTERTSEAIDRSPTDARMYRLQP